MKRLGFLWFFLLLLPQICSAWWNEDWSNKKKINIDAQILSKQGVSIPDGSFALIRLHTGNFGNFLDLADKGKDIRILSADEKTPLKFFIEKLDPINEMALIWVKLPKGIADMPEPAIWLYSGNPMAADAEDAAGSFDVSQIVSYPITTEGVKDFTANNNQPAEVTATIAEAGLMGAAAQFDGSQFIRIPASPSLQRLPEQGWTLTTWLKFDQAQPEDQVVFQTSSANEKLTLYVRDGLPVIDVESNVAGKQNFVGLTPMQAGNWHHLALVVSAEKLEIYLDGKQAGSFPVSLPAFSEGMTLGANAEGGQGFVGLMDLVAIYKMPLSANALSFAALTQASNSSWLSYGADVSSDDDEEGGSESPILSILKSVTTDGWVIIGILGVMLAVGILIMISKGIVLVKNHNENHNFEKEFIKLQAKDIEALNREDTEDDEEVESSPLLASITGGHERFVGSSIYRLYHIGVEELHHRLPKSVGADVAEEVQVSDRGIDSIRSAMESGLVREVQKLNSYMVLLTIAISGGPFLGLLGTVMGVMVTFGEIAASGEVNVAAIAPGIAAALATTVAGLLVAIPCLFGYNYLNSRIKLITADMYIFLDEFVAKLSERYGR